MSKIIHGILQNVIFNNTGPGTYDIENALYVNQTDLAGNGTSDIIPGFIIYTPVMDANSGIQIPEEVNRYVVTSVTILDFSTVNLSIQYDGAGEESNPPANGVDCPISQPSPLLRYGMPVSTQSYTSLPIGIEIASQNEDLLKITDNISGGGGGGTPLPPGGQGQVLWGGVSPAWRYIHQSDIIPDFKITSFAPGNAIFQVGQVLNSLVLNVSATRSIISAQASDLINGSASVTVNSGTFNYPFSLVQNTQTSILLNLRALDIENEVALSSVRIYWKSLIYWGAGLCGSDLGAFILGLSNSRLNDTKVSTSLTVDAGSTNKIYFAQPSSFSSPTFSVSGFFGGFLLLGSVEITNSYGVSMTYDLYESDQPGLGLTTVVVS